MMLLAFIGTALIGLLPVEFRSSSRNQLDVQGHYAASAGIRYANTWFTSVITPWDPTLPEYYKEADAPDVSKGITVTWGNAPYGPSYDIMGVPSNHLDWERLKLKDLQFPKSGTYIAPEHISGWSSPPKGNVLCGYSGASAPDEDVTDVIATKRPLKMGDDWTVWVAFVPNNNQDTPGSQLGGLNSNFISKPRSYQMISVAFYQGQPYLRAKAVIKEASTAKFARLIGDLAPPDNSAAGIGISGSEWMMGAKNANETLYNGPVHSNKYLPMSIGANVWGTTGTNKTFTGVLSYVSAAPTVGGWNKDDVLWAGGNYNAYDADRRPFQSETDGSAVPTGNADNPDRYSALIKNGKSNLQKVKTVPFPQSSAKLYDLAFGTASNQVSSVYTNTAKIPDGTFGKILNGNTPIMVDGVDANGNIIQVPKKPNGLFINYDGNGALGGVYINGDVKAAILEAVDSGGNPITSTSDLASTQFSTTSTMNQAIRIQDEQLSTREVVATVLTTSSSKTVATTKTTTYVTGVQPVTSSNAVATSTVRTTSSVPSTITSTVQVPTTTYSSCTNRSTATQTNVPVGTTTNRTTSSSYVSDANGSGSAGWQLATATTKTTQLGNKTQVTTSTSRCGTTTQNVGSQQTSAGPNVQVVATTYPISYGAPVTSTTFSTNANVATSKATTWTTVTQSSPVTQYETWHAMDQAIITNGAASQSVVIPATLDMTGAAYRTPAGASGSFTFDNSKTGNLLDLATGTRKPMTVLDQNGVPIANSGQTVGPNEMAVLKQSRTDPSQVYLFIVPKKIATSGPDNGKPINGGTGNTGVFYADGNINGLGGVNVGKKTIAAQNNALGSKEISIADNVLTLGTAAKAQPNIHTNGLGLIAENVNIVARNDKFDANQTSDPLLIYAIIMAGKNTSDGGMRVKRADSPAENFLNNSNLPNDLKALGYNGNDHVMSAAEWLLYQANLNNGVNDYNTNFDMNYLTGKYKTGAGIGSNTPLFKMYGGLLEKVPRIIYITGLNTAGWQSSFSYDQLLANDPPPGWPTQGKPEVISYQEERL
jgi:hypothetical protein